MTRKVLAAILFAFCLLSSAYAQPRKGDSLRHLITIRTTDDTVKVNLLLQLAGKFEQVNADSLYNNATKAMALSQRLHYAKGIANSYELLGVAQDMLGKYDSAISLYKQSLEIARLNKLYNITCPKYNHVGNVFFIKAKYLDAGIYYDSSLRAARVAGDSATEASAYGNIANIYYKTGNYSRALHFYLMALSINEAIDSKNGVAVNLSDIANVYYRIGGYGKAIQYLSRSLELTRKIGNTEHIVACLNTYALIYDDRKMYDSSLYYLQQCYALATKMKDPFTQNLLKGNMAEAYLKKGEYDKAYQLYNESLTTSEQLGDAEGKAMAQAGLGVILLKHNDIKGLSYLSGAMAAMQQLGIKEQVIDIAGKLEQYYETKGDFKQALHFDKIRDNYADSLKTQQTQKDAEQMMFGYELQKKEDKIQLLEKDNAIVQGQNQTQRLLMVTLAAGLILTIIIAYLFFRNVRNERRNNTLILKQKEEIEIQRQKLIALNEFKDNTFSVLSHDLRSPVNALASSLMLIDEQIMSPEEFSQHKQELNNKLQSVNLLLDNLLQWAKSQMKGENTPDIERINIKRATLKSIAILKDIAAHKNIAIINIVDDNLWAYGDKNEVDIVIRNLLSNAIKFTPQNGEVNISARHNKDVIELMIADNGMGMTDEQLNQLFSGKANTSTVGTSGERGTGLGLKLCYDIIRKNNGDIKVSSLKGAGSVFTIVLPRAIA